VTSPPFLFGPGNAEIYAISQVAIILVSLLLTIIVISAYSKTKIGRLKYVIAAFSLFALHATINLINSFFPNIISEDLRFASTSFTLLSILILLFIGFVKKGNNEKGRIKIKKESLDEVDDLK
jgi:hypothetical protein